MSQERIDPFLVSLETPSQVDRAVATGLRKLPRVDALEMRVRFENLSGAAVAAPLDEIGTGLVIEYAVEGRPPVLDDATPPPPRDGALMTVAPGEAEIVRLTIEPPESLVAGFDEPTPLRICVRWRAEWLRADNYAPAAVTWNPDIELCETVLLVDDE